MHLEAGVNSRLDELQAAILGVRLARLLAEWNERRRQRGRAVRYTALAGTRPLPAAAHRRRHAWHLYVVGTPARDALAAALGAAGVGTLVHYPIPCHRQAAFAGDAVAALACPSPTAGGRHPVAADRAASRGEPPSTVVIDVVRSVAHAQAA